MMKKNEKTSVENCKKDYIPPSITIDFIEMEYGIAVQSVITVPVGTGTNGEVTTQWDGQDDTTLIAPY
ncbi:hypothetical protein ATE49_15570 [Elizabethkingia miricola]|nr:hypothetical protein ATE49_15570 [Elizabethkingia miricola]